MSNYRVVYFATHALVAGEVEKFAKVKAEPALVLSIPEKPTEDDDGLLRASDVAMLKMNADFVVLSACNTAAGDKPGAEALSGLARAFFYAGAKSLVVSHWEVDSDATVELMDGLFEALKANPRLSHAEALQVSMLRMIANSSKPEWAQPSFGRRSSSLENLKSIDTLSRALEVLNRLFSFTAALHITCRHKLSVWM